MTKKLTIKQSKFLSEYFKTGNGTKSAMKVYNCKNVYSAQALASETLSKLKDVVKVMMEAKGLSLGKLVDVVGDATKANKVISSHTEPDYAVPDHQVRLKAVEIASKWLKLEAPSTLIQINVKPILGGKTNVQGSKGDDQVVEIKETN